MRIEVLEPTGIKTEEYGHLEQGDIKKVADHLGRFYCANGWARDVDGNTPTGKRGSLDNINPNEWDGGEGPKAEEVKPKKASHKA